MNSSHARLRNVSLDHETLQCRSCIDRNEARTGIPRTVIRTSWPLRARNKYSLRFARRCVAATSIQPLYGHDSRLAFDVCGVALERGD